MKKLCLIFISIAAFVLLSVSANASAMSWPINNYPYTGTYYVLPVSDYRIGGSAEVTNQVAQVGNFSVRVAGSSYIFNVDLDRYVIAGSYDETNTAALSNYVYIQTSTSSNSYTYVEGYCVVNGGMTFPTIRAYK